MPPKVSPSSIEISFSIPNLIKVASGKEAQASSFLGVHFSWMTWIHIEEI